MGRGGRGRGGRGRGGGRGRRSGGGRGRKGPWLTQSRSAEERATLDFEELRVSGPEKETFGYEHGRGVGERRGVSWIWSCQSGSRPPVAKFMDYSKYKYEKEKKDREKKRQAKLTQVELKEVKMRYNIDTHDYDVDCDPREVLHGDSESDLPVSRWRMISAHRRDVRPIYGRYRRVWNCREATRYGRERDDMYIVPRVTKEKGKSQ